MPSPPSDHPSPDELRRFATGHLEDDQCRKVESHLEECADCSALLERPLDDDPFVDLVRKADNARRTRAGNDHTVEFDSASGEHVASRENELLAIEIDGYENLEELGRGGMGVVYRARHRRLKRDVALKVVLAGAHSGPDERMRFRQEAETIARLQHSGIVQIFEVGEQQGHPYLALELVDGQTLSELTKCEPQPFRWSATMMLQIARAVHFAHQQSVVHRDLKPGNVLLVKQAAPDDSDHTTWAPPISDSSGTAPLAVPVAKITDFGLAKQLDSEHQLTQTGLAVGTPAYMAPEQAAGKTLSVGPATDVYALGAMLYELLTGRPPFVDESLMSMVMAVLEDDPDPPSKHRKQVPRDLETICLKCLMKEPAQRYASAQDLANDLELYLQGEPILARPLGLGGQLMRCARRRPVLAATYTSCIAMLSLHLFAKYVLQLPWHNSSISYVIVALMVGWSASATILQPFFDNSRRRTLGQFAYIGVTLLGFTVMFTFDAGPNSAPIAAYLVAIVVAGLLVPRPSMTWFVTGLAALSYTWLVGHAFWRSPDDMVTWEHVIAFFMCILLTGISMHLLLRRAVKSQQTEGESISVRARSSAQD